MTENARNKKRKNWKWSAAMVLKSLGKLRWKRRYGFGRTIAIYIDEFSIQFAVVKRFWHITRLLNVTKVYIPSNYDAREKRENFITAEINDYVSQYRRRMTRFVLGVGGPESAIRTLSLPEMSGRELAQAVFWEGNKKIPFGLEEAFWGYHVIVNDGSDSGNLRRVSLLAISKKEVNRPLDQIKTDIRFDAVYHKLEAIGFLLPHIEGFSEEKTYTLVNIKRNHSEISFYRGARLDFKHVASIGTGTVTGAGRDRKKYDAFTEALVAEIQNSLDYYSGQFSHTAIDTVFVYGDLSYSEDLINLLTDRFDIEFCRFPLDRWLATQPQAREFAEQIPVSLGAVALAIANEEMVNFLPPNLKEKNDARHFYHRAVPALAGFTAILLFILASFQLQVDTNKTVLSAAQNQMRQFETSPSFVIYNQIKQRMAADENLVKQLAHTPSLLNLNLKELSLLTPGGVWLESYLLEGDAPHYSLILTGRAISSAPPPEIILAEFITRLEGSPFFDKIILKKQNKKSLGAEFSLEFCLEMEAVI
jgi:Tfp pilus assembly PilM family ATPase